LQAIHELLLKLRRSPLLLPKPKDWGSHISVSGFFLLPADDGFKPPSDLLEFLEAGDPPIYIGFGSVVVDNPEAMTSMILEAVSQAGVRALVSRGWGGLGSMNMKLPENVFLLGNIPHTWLFERVSVVVIHGGAGTTAASLFSGKPTVIVPFFGDVSYSSLFRTGSNDIQQYFWGGVIANAGAGPHPIPYREQTAEKLAQQIKEALHPESRVRARQIGLRLRQERGCERGARSFHDALSEKHSRCSVLPTRVAVWEVKGAQGIKCRLSPLAAAILLQRELICLEDISL
jgi:UDP:flavonoid glycosyltransferase YjiC (YdhE family)